LFGNSFNRNRPPFHREFDINEEEDEDMAEFMNQFENNEVEDDTFMEERSQ